MTSNISRFRGDLSQLQHTGTLLELAMIKETHGLDRVKESLKNLDEARQKSFLHEIPQFRVRYEAWYSECLSLLKQLLPDRLASFKSHYEIPKGRKSVEYGNYVIEDYMMNLQVTLAVGDIKVDTKAAFPRLQSQTAILAAVESRFESSLFDLRQLVQADVFDGEIASATALVKAKLLRAAGAIVGVVLERHLGQVCESHNIALSKRNPTISDFNDALKNAEAIDVPVWRRISLLGDIRNLCVHNKDREPTPDELDTLLSGANIILKGVF